MLCKWESDKRNKGFKYLILSNNGDTNLKPQQTGH